MRIYGIRDKIAKKYRSIRLEDNDQTARRNFSFDAKQNDFLQYAQNDFELYCIGEFDLETGAIVPVSPQLFVCSAAEVLVE